jgi:peptidoglycan/LPS O-acetylase OafA/YrhL
MKRRPETSLLKLMAISVLSFWGGFFLYQGQKDKSCMAGWYFIIFGIILSPAFGIGSAIITIREFKNLTLGYQITGFVPLIQFVVFFVVIFIASIISVYGVGTFLVGLLFLSPILIKLIIELNRWRRRKIVIREDRGH